MLFILVFIILAQTSRTAFINRYNIDLEQVEVCPGNDLMESPIRNLKFVFLNRTTRSISFDINFINPIDANVGFMLLLYKWTAGSWVSVPFLPFQPNQCVAQNTYFKENWIMFTTALGVKHPKKCPIPAGNYSMKNLIFDFQSIKIPFWNGRFKIHALSKRVDNKKDVYCLMFTVNIAEVLRS